MPRFSTSAKLLAVLLLSATAAWGQACFPTAHGDRMSYNALIELPRGYMSGICMMVNSNDTIRGSLFNEFGISALDFTYLAGKRRVRLHHVVGPLNRWYLKRVVSHDLARLFEAMQRGDSTYTNERRNIRYQLTPISNDSEE